MTVRTGGIGGAKLLVVRPEGGDQASAFVAVDTVGAGSGDLVLVAQGSAARVPEATASVPTDATVIGIVDEASHDPGG
jgi:ethanolamine utilization protein EutN